MTHYFETRTCDARFAARLRAAADRFMLTRDTPDCTPGSFMGSYANTQNPPEYAVVLTTGYRLLQDRLTFGGRVAYHSGPTEEINLPWQQGFTTPQLLYRPEVILDAFASYELRENLVLSVSARNLTDRYYVDPLAQSYMPSPGRTVRAALSVRF